MKLFNYFVVLLTVCIGCVSSEPSFWSNDRITNLTDIKATVILWEKEAVPNYRFDNYGNVSNPFRQRVGAVVMPGDSYEFPALYDSFCENDTVYVNEPFVNIDSISIIFANSTMCGFRRGNAQKYSPFVYANNQVYKLSESRYVFEYRITDALLSIAEKIKVKEEVK